MQGPQLDYAMRDGAGRAVVAAWSPYPIVTNFAMAGPLQLVQQVRQAVLLGFLRPGDRLPLIREVVEDLAINPNTVAKAYRQMEQENLATGRPGQGTFVNEQQSAVMPASTYTSLRRGLTTWLRRAYAAGLDEQAVNALFTSVHQQTRNEEVA